MRGKSKEQTMRRLVAAASMAVSVAAILATAQAQTGTSVWQLQFDAANITAAKSKFGLTAGALEWNPAKPEQSTLALSLDTTTLGDDAVKTELDAAHNPELRIMTSGPGRASGGTINLPTNVTVRDVIKPVTFQVSYKAEGRLITMHAEGTLRASDFKLKGGDIPLVIDAPFKPATAQ
jgi:polyisoprenoid-binding protein YceI